MNRRTLLAGAAAYGALGAAPPPPSPAIEIGGGWREALGVVADLDAAARFWRDVAGWTQIHDGRICPEALTLFGMNPRAMRGRERVFAARDYPLGWVRLWRFDGGANAGLIRSNAQAWDTGGIFSVMTRSQNIDRDYAAAGALGLTAFNDPYAFNFGDRVLVNGVIRSPDGCNVAIYERRTPRDPSVIADGLTKAFNSMQMVRDLEVSTRWWIDAAGFEFIQRGRFVDDVERPTNFALPVNLATKVPRNFSILKRKDGSGEAGRVELMQFEGLVGRDFSDDARFPKRGWHALLFPVLDLQVEVERFAASGMRPAFGPGPLPLAPYGSTTAAAFRSPDGVLAVFYVSPTSGALRSG